MDKEENKMYVCAYTHTYMHVMKYYSNFKKND